MRYVHHSGGEYDLLRIANDQTNARAGAMVAVYRSLDTGKIYARDLFEFCLPVLWPDGETRPRFFEKSLISDNDGDRQDRLGGWIESHCQDGTAFKIWPMDVRKGDLRGRIWPLAHALGNICRYGGHCRRFYSVAQHATIVSYMVPPRFGLQGLLHDLTEGTGLGDIVAPIKGYLLDYGPAEERAWIEVSRDFGVSVMISDEVERADKLIVATEKRDLHGPYHAGPWKCDQDDLRPLPLRIVPAGPIAAREMFLRRFEELTAPGQAPDPDPIRIAWNRARFAIGIRTMRSGAELAGVWTCT